jgi:hypothetical protein
MILNRTRQLNIIQFIFFVYTMANAWLQHLAKFRKNNKDVKPSEMMQKARKTYQNGGGVPTPYVKSGMGSPITMNKLTGGGVVPFEAESSNSMPARVGGRRSRRQSRRKSRRTRRR